MRSGTVSRRVFFKRAAAVMVALGLVKSVVPFAKQKLTRAMSVVPPPLPSPQLFDPTHRLTIGPPISPQEEALFGAGATSMVRDTATGELLGVYVDVETPDRDKVAAIMVSLLPGKLVIVSEFHNPSLRLPGCVVAYLWFPFYGRTSMGMPRRWNMGLGLFKRMPRAWILQWNFAWTTAEMDRNYPPPTQAQRDGLYRWVKLHHPFAKLIWSY